MLGACWVHAGWCMLGGAGWVVLADSVHNAPPPHSGKGWCGGCWEAAGKCFLCQDCAIMGYIRLQYRRLGPLN